MTSCSKNKTCEKCGATFAIHFSSEGVLAEKCNCSNSIWQPIETVPIPTEGLVLIAKFDLPLRVPEWLHASYWADGWALPFDSERDENGTPFLNEDEKPTHWMPLPKFIN